MAGIPPMQAFSLGADAVHLSKRPLPTAPDGHYDWENQSDPSSSPQSHAAVTNLLNTGFFNPDPSVVGAFVDAALHPEAIDDRKGLFAQGIALLSRLPPQSHAAKKLADFSHLGTPPAALLGPIHSFRRADGGGNNLESPDLGRAGMPYARSVQGKWCIEPTSLPDPGLIFDTLMKARHRKIHPAGNSSLTFAVASLVTHFLFRSDPRDWNINTTSSYLDLSPLYGVDQAAQDLVRNKGMGRGLLYPDTFSEDRLMFLPPAVSALLVLLSRNHNYIATILLKINERGHWTEPPPEGKEQSAKQDEEIFQTARLVNCGHFMNLFMDDYVAGFLGRSEGVESSLFNNVFGPIKTKEGLEVERGLGNHCSLEFNLIYRWHPTLSTADEKWTENIFHKVFNYKPFDQLTLSAASLLAFDPDPNKRTFGGLKRGPGGNFSDDDIAKTLLDATESPASAFGAQGTPGVLKVIEIMGILQARKWGVCTMNEFRQFLGLKRFNDFEDWNPDPEIAGTARRLYGHIDNLELYTGLQCEATMPLLPAVRFACGYTLVKGILGDAVALLRGDRFYTTDFTPGNLTVWGYQSCQRDPNNVPRLFLRHLPRHYPFNSVYACFPLFTPQKMKESLTAQGIAAKYSFDRPVPARQPKILNTFTGIKDVFNDPARFPVIYDDLRHVGGGYGSFLCFDTPAKHNPDRALAIHTFFPSENSLAGYREWYRNFVSQKIKERSWKYSGVSGNHIDIVKSVINSASVHWVADCLCGLPLKTKENPRGLYTEEEIYGIMNYLAVSNNENTFSVRSAAHDAVGVIQALITQAILDVDPQSSPNVVTGLIGKVNRYLWPPFSKPYYPFLSKLCESGRPVNELVGTVISLAMGSCINYAQATVHVIDFYLDEARKAERLQILKLVNKDDSKSTEMLRGYVREGMRLHPQFTTIGREAAVDAVIHQGHCLPDVQVKTGDRIMGNFKNAHLNPNDFPNPTTIDPTRAASSYSLTGSGSHNCIGDTYVLQTIAETVKVIFKLKNVQRAAGNSGKLAGFKIIVDEAETNIYLTPYGTISPWPSSMHLVVSATPAPRFAFPRPSSTV
ncbi:heme peroxidase [Mycena latifolia]|nr:heme peroxidase [Mycena latifolia]